MRTTQRHSRAWIPLLLLVIAVVTPIILLREVYVVRNVEISGSQAFAYEEVLRASKIALGTSIFRVDEDAVREGVNRLGTIRLDSMEVSRPNTVILRVSDRKRDAMLMHMGQIRLLDEECCLVESVAEVPDTDLIYVSGMSVTGMYLGEPLRAGEGQVEACRAILQAINDNGAKPYVSEIDLSDVNALRLITRTGIVVELGDMQNMQNKISWMKSTVADLQQRSEGGGTLDVSSGNKADYSGIGVGADASEDAA